jgi:uncharacterized membrane protein
LFVTTLFEASPMKQASPSRANPWPDRFLGFSGVLWFLAAAIGQWIFVLYIAAYYVPVLARSGLPGLEQTRLPEGYVPGDGPGNLATAFHVVIAIIIIGAGPLQLIPPLRNRFPAFHRFVGRIYMTTAILTSIAGLFMVWTRGVVGGPLAIYGISLDAILIILFAAIALRYAMARKIDQHRRWAMRLFMVVSAVWFFRIGMMFWFMTTGGVGIDSETFTGPFLDFIYFGQMIVPLLFLEIYFRAQDNHAAAPKIAATLLVLLATGITAVGVFAATMGMWLPEL